MRVLVLESEGLYRDGVCLAFSSQGWEASAPDDFDDVAATVARLMPTIVILGHQGLLRLSRSASAQFAVPMLALIATDDIHAIRAAMRLRIHGLVHRDTTREELLAAVRACLNGEGYVSSSLATAVARAAMGLEDRRHLDLTERQQEIAKMVCAGMSSVEIARVLGISRRTVEFHRTRILKKLGVHTAVEMAQLLALISAHNQEDVNVIPSIPA